MPRRRPVLAQKPRTVILDEIQTVPALLPEVHWLLENTPTRFILCGSSARKLRRGSTNLLGGRAVDHHLHPLTSVEIGDVDLLRLLRHGALPVHYLVDDPRPLLKAYVNNYLKQEIIDESATRNVAAFSRFLEVVALGHGQQINYTNVARESGVSANTVRNYYQILEDTLLGFTLEPWRKRKKRRLVQTAKFYLFHVGVANQIHPEARSIDEGSDLYGRAFEHFVLNEVRAWIEYERLDLPLAFWRTSSGFEVDLIVGDLDVAIECKSTREIRAVDGERRSWSPPGPRARRHDSQQHSFLVAGGSIAGTNARRPTGPCSIQRSCRCHGRGCDGDLGSAVLMLMFAFGGYERRVPTGAGSTGQGIAGDAPAVVA